MTEIHIPFLDQFKEPMLNGTKTMTSRNSWYGTLGDVFTAFGATFKIVAQQKILLGVIAHHHFLEEGFNSADEFIECWKRLHPRKGYTPDLWVKVHIFKRIKEAQL